MYEPGPVPISTRSGTRTAHVGDRSGADEVADVTVDLGPYERPDLGPVQIRIGSRTWPATPVRMPNPHLVAMVDHLDDAGELRTAPLVEPPDAAPDGANVELVVRRGPRHVAMRVFERGAETRPGPAVAGDIATVLGLGEVAVGDQLGRWEAARSGRQFLPPGLESVVQPRDPADRIALFQALTQIQEQTLIYVPKIVAVLGGLLLLLPFMSDALASYMARIAERIASGG